MENTVGYDVIIAIKDGIEFIEQAIDSVLGQTLKPNQILLINDHSSDGSVELVLKKYPTVRLIHSDLHGQANALNLGLRVSKSEFIAFLDSDDYWSAKKQEKQMRLLLNHPDTYFASSGVLNFLHGSDFKTASRQFLKSKQLGACTFRKKVFDEFGFFDTGAFEAVFIYEFFTRLGEIHFASTDSVELYRRIHNNNYWISQRKNLYSSLFKFLRERKVT